MSTPRLVPQRYGIAMAQCTFGGPRGIWLECTGCDRSDRLIGVKSTITDAAAAKLYRNAGWSGVGDRMMKARCPSCNLRGVDAALSNMRVAV